MVSLNKVMLIGNVGRDPEMRYTPNGHAVATFSLATNRFIGTGEGGERKQETDWHRIVVWEKQAEQVNQLVTKGKRVFVEGRIQTRSWEGQDGQKRTTTEIVASRVLLLDRQPSAASLPGESSEPGEAGSDEIPPEDVPF